jgi:phosphatidylglycerophosphate synthase
MPTIAELREATQPASIFERNSGEHWAGRLYMRRLSPYCTRLLLRLGFRANAVTWLMIVVGLAAAAVLSLPGVWAAVGAVLLIQLQLLLDCSDGEVARWRDEKSPVGVYLDRIGHWLTEAALPIALGVRADGGWDSLGTYTALGLLIAVFVLLIKGESALVTVARAESGRPPADDTAAVAAPRAAGLAQLRRTARLAPFFRAFVAVEATLLALAAALLDLAGDDLRGSRALVVTLVGIGALTAAGHLVAILNSSRLR